MKKVKKIQESELYQDLIEIIRIGNEAIKLAKEENKKMGIPEVFVKRGKLYFELLSGEITEDRPEILKNPV